MFCFQYTAYFGLLEYIHYFYIWLATPPSTQESRVLTSRKSVSRKISVWIFFKLFHPKGQGTGGLQRSLAT